MKEIQRLAIAVWLCVNLLLPETLHAQTCEVPACGHQQVPAGVMISHLHCKGSGMLLYRYMSMEMRGMQQNSIGINDQKVFENYLMADQRMHVDMHMIMGMYGVTDRLTLMLMGSYNNQKMTMRMMPSEGTQVAHVHSQSGTMAMTSGGIGDTRINVLFGVVNTGSDVVLISGGVTLPTGSISQKGSRAGMYSGCDLPYSMQTGSGTWDLLPGVSYVHTTRTISTGSQVSSVIRPGYNAKGYRLGNELTINQWFACQWGKSWSSSLRLEGVSTSKIRGRNRSLDPYLEPTADSRNSGGRQLNGYCGLNFCPSNGMLRSQKVSLEVGHSIAQTVNGIQLKNTWGISASWSIRI